MNSLLRLFAIASIGLLTACGGGGGGGSDDPFTGNPDPGAVAALVSLAADTTTVRSDSSDAAQITATVLDGNNGRMVGAEVQFSTRTGELSASQVSTDDEGVATVTFRAGTLDRSNRVETITARSGGKTQQIAVMVTGSALAFSTSGNTSLPADGSASAIITVSATDGGDAAVSGAIVCVDPQSSDGGRVNLSTIGGASLSAACGLSGGSGVKVGTTGFDGTLSFAVSGATAGNVTLVAYGLGTSATQSVSVSNPAEEFRITSPESGTARTVGDAQVVVVSAPGASEVTFATSHGNWLQNGGRTYTAAVTDGEARATLTSSVAAIADVSAFDADNPARAASIRVGFAADAASAGKLSLSASRTTLPVSDGGVTYSSVITAKVLTINDEVVEGAIVSFSALNGTGGGERLYPPIAITDAAGQATTTFTSGTQASGGIAIQASVLHPDPNITIPPRSVIIKITGGAGSVVVGTSTELVVSQDNTTYSLPMTVLVADGSGNPVANAPVTLRARPAGFSYGVRDRIISNAITDGVAIVTDTLPAEDVNENEILDPGEDFDRNGAITPPNSVALIQLPEGSSGGQGVVTTDSNGMASFSLLYPKDYASWVVERITATTPVEGTELASDIQVRLPATEDDVTDLLLSNSPFNANCPFGVSVSRSTVYVPAGGAGTATLTLFDPDGITSTAGRPVTAMVDLDNSSTGFNPLATGGYTNAAGRFTSTLTANTDAENGDYATIRYYASCAYATVSLVVGDVQTIDQIDVSGASSVVVGNATPITVRLVDEAGVPLSGEQVSVAFVQNATGGSLSPTAGTTNANGVFTTTYTAGASPGTDVIVATWLVDGVPAASETKTITANVVGGIQVTSGASSVPVGGAIPVTIRAVVTDTSGNAAAGVPVTFATTAGTFSGGSKNTTATTDAAGIADVSLYSDDTVGTATVTAQAGGFLGTVSVAFIQGTATSLTLTAASTSLRIGEQVTLTANLRDGQGNPVPSTNIVFSASSASAGNFVPAQASTDASGQATTVFTALAAGSFTLRARTAEGASASVSVTITAAATGAASLSVAASRYTVQSDNSNSAVITATALDSNNAAVEGVTVEFSTTGGKLSASTVETNANGEAVVTFSSGTADPTNRTVQVTATAGPLSDSLPIQIVGSRVVITPPSSTTLIIGASPTTITVTAQNAGGLPVFGTDLSLTLSGAGGGYLGAAAGTTTLTGTTDVNGQFTTTISGTAAGAVTLTVQGLGATATQAFTVQGQAQALTIESVQGPSDPAAITPAPETYTLPVEADTTDGTIDQGLLIRVSAPGAMAHVTFVASHGVWDDGDNAPDAGDSRVRQVAVAGGIASATLYAATSGTASVQVFNSASPSESDAMTVMIVNQTVNANSRIDLQAESSTVPVSVGDTSYSTTLVGTVYDQATNEPIVGAAVVFAIENPTGGGETVFPAYALTDSNGEVRTTFTSGSESSNSAVRVSAQVYDAANNPVVGASDSVDIYINQTATSVVVSRGTVIRSASDDTVYELPMAVLVSDAAGNPIGGQTVTLRTWPRRFSTGYWLDAGNECIATVTGSFDNEDRDRDQVLDAGEDSRVDETSTGIDLNGDGDTLDWSLDGQLTPGNSAAGALPFQVTTDENGVANFELNYLKDYSVWISALISATTVVDGTETIGNLAMTLPFLEDESCNLSSSPFNPPFSPGTAGVYDAISGAVITLTAGDSPLYRLSGPSDMSLTAITARVTDASGSPLSGLTVNFSLTSSTGAPAAIAPGSAVTNASGVASVTYTAGDDPGFDTVSASVLKDGTLYANDLTVQVATLQGIAITPETPTLLIGSTQQLTATGTFSNGTNVDLTTVANWVSNAPAVASVSNAIGSKGRVSADPVVTGTAIVTGTVNDHTGTPVTGAAEVEVVDTL